MARVTLTVQQCAKQLGVPDVTIYRAIKTGKLEFELIDEPSMRPRSSQAKRRQLYRIFRDSFREFADNYQSGR